MSTPQTDTPETDAFRRSKSHHAEWEWANFASALERRANAAEAAQGAEMTLQEQLIAAHRRIGIEHTEMRVQRDRANAAEARVKELESMVITHIKGDEWQAQAKQLAEARAARRLRPIAEAGPVPELSLIHI